MRLVTAAQMRELDFRTINEIGIDGLVLMELAGKGAFDFIRRQDWLPDLEAPVLLLAGKGNNGGDAFVVARWLLLAGYRRITMMLLAEKAALQGDARRNLETFTAVGGQVREITSLSDWVEFSGRHRGRYRLVIDGLLGTGLNSEVRGLYAAVIERLPVLGDFVLALDIPSGLHADRGVPLGVAVRATATVTFGYGKPGLFVYPGRQYAGRTEVVPIGIPPSLLPGETFLELLTTPAAAKLLPPPPDANCHKGSRGHLLTIAGSRGKSGAGIHAGMAALKTGCGLATLATPELVAAALEGCHPDLMLQPLPDNGQGLVGTVDRELAAKMAAGKQALAIGPGLGTHPEAGELLAAVLERSQVPMVLDADALTLAARNPELLAASREPLILTPHPGEMARLLGISSREVQENRLELAADFAREQRVFLVLKGAGTVIAAPDGAVAINDSGNPVLATAGAGDLLTGIVAGFLAQGLDPWPAARLGVHLHGLAADLLAAGDRSCGATASDILALLPAALTQLYTYQENADETCP